MDSPCIKQTVCKVLKIFQCGKYLVAYVLKPGSIVLSYQCLHCLNFQIKSDDVKRVSHSLQVELIDTGRLN